MDFPRLNVFQTVAQYSSFTKAAEELHLSQPAVSKHIRLLEAELGVTLFDRLGNRVQLTDAGRIMRDYTQRVSLLTVEVQRVLDELRGLQRGHLRIGASSTPGLYIIPEALSLFQIEHPQIEATLVISNSADIARRLLSGEIDVGFVGAVEQNLAGLQIRPFAEDEVVLIVPPQHPLVQQHAYTPRMFAQETLIIREKGSGTRQLVEAQAARLNLTPNRLFELTGCDAVKRAVEAGLGLAFVSRRAVALEETSGCVRLPAISDLRFRRQLYVLTRKDARPTATVLAFTALTVKRGNAVGDKPTPTWAESKKVVGMLSVNGYTSQVFLHTWHGNFIEMNESEK